MCGLKEEAKSMSGGGNGAMTEAELETWEAEFWADQERDALAQPALSSHMQAVWVVVACLGGVGAAVLVMWGVFRAVSAMADDDLSVDEWDRRHAIASARVGGHGHGHRHGASENSKIDDTSGKCAICGQKHQGGVTWQQNGFGGCGYLTCHECYINYRPLASRCEMCGQFYCYRRGRVTFKDLSEAEAQGEIGANQIVMQDDDDPRKAGDPPEDMDAGLRKRK